MDRTGFDALDIEDKIKYLNKELKDGNTVTRVREDLRLGEKTLQKMIKNSGYRYNQKLRQYDKCNIDIIQIQSTVVEDKSNTFVIPDNFQSDIIEILQMKDDLKEIVKSFKGGYDKEHTSIIEVIADEGIKIDLPEADVVRTTVRVNQKALDKWNKFCDEYSEYSKTNLLSMCMLEYIDRYESKK